MDDKKFYERIGQKLKQYRKECGLTQEQAGEIVGITKSAIVNYETGIRKIPLETLIALSDAYNVTLASLLDKEKTLAEFLKSKIGQVQLTKQQEELLINYIQLLIGKEK